jgi:hypothetical protein
MPIAVTVVLFVFWIAMAYREIQRGNTMLAGLFIVVGIVLTVYRIRAAQRLGKPGR